MMNSDFFVSQVRQLDDLASEIANLVSQGACYSTAVSAWTVGQHLEHTLISISSCIKGLLYQTPFVGVREKNEYRDYLFKHESIPRGAIAAPAVAMPSSDATEKTITRLLRKTSNRIRVFSDIVENRTILHPIMGVLSRDECAHFLVIHTRHHLAIIADIMQENADN